MSTDALKPLMFTVGLIDKITGPAHKATQSFQSLTDTAKTGFADIGTGAASLWATSLAVGSLVQPAMELEKSLNALKSLGMDDSEVAQFGKSAVKMSTEFGVSASELATSAYAIQSAMGLTGKELESYTRVSGILAKATLADSETISTYMTTMYGVFRNTADEMGRADWANLMAGQTAEAVRMFRTSGFEMASAFGNLTSSATDFGVQMHEQIAILGTLQNVIPSGSEAASAYRAFLAGAQKAQGDIGVNLFADDAMKIMLPIEEVLKNLEGVEGLELQTAFGSQEAVKFLSVLRNNTTALTKGLEGIGRVRGMDNAMEMAEKNISPWEQLAVSIEAVKIGFSSALIPVLNPMASTLANVGGEIHEFTVLFPNITRLIGATTAVIIGLTGAMAALSVIMGIKQTVMAGWLVLVRAVRGVTMLWTAAQWALNAAMIVAASPISAVVLIVTGAIAAMTAMAYALKTTWELLSNTSWSEAFSGAINLVIGMFYALKETAGNVIGWVIDKINLIPGINIGATAETQAETQITTVLPEMVSGVENVVPDMTQITPVLPEMVSGVENVVPDMTQPEDLAIDIPYRREGMENNVPAEGAVVRTTNANKNDNSQRTNYVEIKTSQSMSPALLNEFLLMEGA